MTIIATNHAGLRRGWLCFFSGGLGGEAPLREG